MVDLPGIPKRTPTVTAPTPVVSRADVASPYVQFAQGLEAEAQAYGLQARSFERTAEVMKSAGREAEEVAKPFAIEAGLQAVTRDENGNVRVEKAPIVGDAALYYQHAVQVAAVADGEQVMKNDMLAIRREHENDPEGFRIAVNKYATEKVKQYETAAGAQVGLTLGKLASNTAREYYNGLINQKESRDLQKATRSIELQIETTQNELFAMANGGDTSSPEYVQRLEKVGALWGQLAGNPRLNVPKERVEFEMAKLTSQLDVAALDFRLKTVQAEKGVDAALAEAERVRTDPKLDLTPQQRFTMHSQLVQGIAQRARAEAAVDKTVADQIKQVSDAAAEGYPVPAAQIATVRQAVAQSKNPALGAALDAIEAAQPIIADWRKASPATLERNLSELDKVMREKGATPQLLALRDTGTKLLKNMRDQLKLDQLGWADRTGAVPVPPIDFAAKNVVDQIRERVGRAEIVANHYGVAPIYFRPDERAVLSQVAAQGGDAMIGLSRLVVEGAGDRAPRALSEIGKDAPVLAHIGGLMTSAGSPAVMRDAAQAVAMRANPDFKFPKWNADGVQQAQHDVTVSVYGGAFKLAPETGRAAEMTAQDAFFARSFEKGYDPKLTGIGPWPESKSQFQRALQEAAGAVFAPDGTQFGGIATYKPGWWTEYKVLIPSNVKADRFGAVIGALRDEDIGGAVAADGKRYSLADIRGAVPVASRGGYRFALGDPLSDDPKWIRGADGRPFVLDIGRLEPVLRQRVPGAYSGEDTSIPPAARLREGALPEGSPLRPGGGESNSRNPFERMFGPAPPAARAYVSTLMGDRSKIDENFFGPNELDILRDVAERALAKGKKVIGYGDYAPGWEKSFATFDGTESALAAISDLPSSLSYTLGMARVRKEKDGTIVITDTYDFNAPKEKVEALKKQGTWAILQVAMRGLAENGLLGPLNLIGNLVMPEGSGGREVEIRIPPRMK